MTVKSKADLKALFEQGDKPTEQDFTDLIDSLSHVNENGSDDIANDSSVDGATVTDALETLDAGKAADAHNHNLADLTEKSYNSLTERPDLVIPTKASDLDNDSVVSGEKISDALNTLNTGKSATSHSHKLTDLITKNYGDLDGLPDLSLIPAITVPYNCDTFGEVNTALNELREYINNILQAFNG